MAAQQVSSTLQRVVAAQLRIHGLELSGLLAEYPARSFEAIRTEIANRTGITLSARTVRRWFNDIPTQQKEAS